MYFTNTIIIGESELTLKSIASSRKTTRILVKHKGPHDNSPTYLASLATFYTQTEIRRETIIFSNI